MSEETTWLQKYWAQLVFVVGISSAAIKNQVDTRATKKAVFDEKGENRLKTIAQCSSHINYCNSRHEKERQDNKRELQNIHDAIKDLNTSVRDMPKVMLETLTSIKALKDD